jgi:hypothetical protein
MASIHTDRKVTVELDGASVVVRELSWPQALELYQRLVGQANKFLTEKGDMVLTPAGVVEAISENIELVPWLAKAATGKDDEWIAQRPVGDVLEVATAAAELNVGIIASRLKNARGRLRGLLGTAPADQPKG